MIVFFAGLAAGCVFGFVGGVVFVLGVRVAARRKRDQLVRAGIEENADGTVTFR